MIKDAINKLADRADLTEQEAETVMGEIMDGSATSAQIAAYLMGLRMKGETVEEIAGSVLAMRARATQIRVKDSMVLDTCAPAAIGLIPSTFQRRRRSWSRVPVLRLPSMAIAPCRRKSGSADVLAALGVAIQLPPEQVADCVNEVGHRIPVCAPCTTAP